MPRWLAPSILALITAAASVLAAYQPPAPRAHLAGLPPPKAAVLSVRRAPEVLSQTIADLHLEAALDSVIADPAAADSCLVVRQGDRTLYSRNPTRPLIPASNLKLLTATAALEALGPSTQFTTTAMADKPPSPDGTIAGPLYLIGGGDPLLETADYAASFKAQPQIHTAFEQLADSLVARGIKHIEGPVLGDESRLDTQRYVASWKPRYITDGEVGPLGALMVNDAFVQWKPKGVPAPQPAVHAAQVLTDLLKGRGVSIDGPPGQSRAPAGAATISELRSPSLTDVVAEMLKQSDNTTAELLTKEMGRRAGAGASTAAGVKAIRAKVAADGLPADQFAAVDGSGLDRSDRATCSLILGALARKPSLKDELPVAGKDGTLYDRFKASPAAGRLHAKTGSLDNVAALSGWVDQPGSTPPLAFSFIANGFTKDAQGRALGDRLGDTLARYPDAPTAASLAP